MVKGLCGLGAGMSCAKWLTWNYSHLLYVQLVRKVINKPS